MVVEIAQRLRQGVARVVEVIAPALPKLIMEDEVDWLTSRQWILFQTITSEYNRGEPAAGAAPGKQCGDAGWHSVAAQAAQRVRQLLRQRSNAMGSHSAMICVTAKMLNQRCWPSLAYGGQIPVQRRVESDLQPVPSRLHRKTRITSINSVDYCGLDKRSSG